MAPPPVIVGVWGPEPKRKYWPWASARYTTTHSAWPVAIVAAACDTAADPPAPPAPQTIWKDRISRTPRAAARRVGSLRSLANDEKPSTSWGSIPASAHAARIACTAITNSGSGEPPRLKYRLSPTPATH